MWLQTQLKGDWVENARSLESDRDVAVPLWSRSLQAHGACSLPRRTDPILENLHGVTAVVELCAVKSRENRPS